MNTRLSVTKKKSTVFGTVFLTASLALPSLRFAYAEAAPERGSVSFKYLNYQDSQSGDSPAKAGMTRERIGVNALSIMGTVPVAGQWSVGVSFLEDSITGASPAYHSSGFPVKQNNTVSGASGELRHAVDVQLTRYFSRGSLTAGSSYSKESDYLSLGYSLQGTLSTEDKNTTFSVGGSFNDDTINLDKPNIAASHYRNTDEHKSVFSGLIGVTQVVTQNDIVQLNLGHSNGNGYFTDPYKDPDNRPRNRSSSTVFTRWNHHFTGTDGTAKLSYRFYSDTFGILAHTFGAEYVQPLHNGWTLTPLLRLYSQCEADFYVAVGADEKADPMKPTSPPADAMYYSEDQRLSAFGAITLGLKVSKELNQDWLVDVKYEGYEQHGKWSVNGNGDPGVASFGARSVQVGLSRKL